MSADQEKPADSFDWMAHWERYAPLAEVDDRSVWAFEFANRDPGLSDQERAAVSVSLDLDAGVTRTVWRNGVLCHGMSGHDTNRWLRGAVQRLEPRETADNPVVTVNAGGPNELRFRTKEAHEHWKARRQAYFGRTVEFAVNILQDKKTLLKEIERIIDEQQAGFISRDLPKLSRQTVRMWTRGLACWDLLQQDFSQYRLAQHLPPMWAGEAVGEGEPSDTDKRDVRDALNAVKPQIEGRWRELCGDPLAYIQLFPSSP